MIVKMEWFSNCKRFRQRLEQRLRRHQSQLVSQWLRCYESSTEGVCLMRLLHWGRIRSDSDRLLLFANLKYQRFPDQACDKAVDTVFVTSTARTIDSSYGLCHWRCSAAIRSPNRRQYLMDWLERQHLFADKVELTDLTYETAAFSLITDQRVNVLLEQGAAANYWSTIRRHYQLVQLVI